MFLVRFSGIVQRKATGLCVEVSVYNTGVFMQKQNPKHVVLLYVITSCVWIAFLNAGNHLYFGFPKANVFLILTVVMHYFK